jgi:hypothetical protein
MCVFIADSSIICSDMPLFNKKSMSNVVGFNKTITSRNDQPAYL